MQENRSGAESMQSQVLSVTRVLKGIVDFTTDIEVKTGLLIRMPVQAQTFRIGGTDQYPMITRKYYPGVGEIEVPYIPGSSLKGRMRSLLELALGKKFYTTDMKIWLHVRSISAMNIQDFINDIIKRCEVDELFGYAAANYKQIKQQIEEEIENAKERGEKVDFPFRDLMEVFGILAPTRLLVEDFFPSEEYVKKANIRSIADFLEEKSENRIDRITSAADPRDIVRVKPGVIFKGKLKLLLFDNDAGMVKKYLSTLVMGMELVEETYLGSSGSRGYGRVKFSNIVVTAKKIEQSKDDLPVLVPIEFDGNKPEQRYNDLQQLKNELDKLADVLTEKIFAQ